MSNRTPIMAGNWKMFKTPAQTSEFFASFNPLVATAAHCEIVICPTFVNLAAAVAGAAGSKVEVGGQNLFWENEGAYTGEISGPMLAKLKCTFVAVGHSERRQYHDETDEIVNAKVKAAYKHGLTPILCVGEELEVREAGNHVSHTLAQVEGGLKDVPAEHAETVVIAYEPVWAIGTGKVCGAEDAQEVCAAIRGKLAELYGQELADKVRIQYGGSVKAGNVAEIMAQADIDGALVGGASLDPDDFARIVQYRLAG